LTIWAAGLLAGGACTFSPGFTLAPGGAGGVSGGGGASPPPMVGGAGGSGGTSVALLPCTGLECRQSSCTAGRCMTTACAPGVSTTVSGTVYDPAGKVPLYNVIVYVPNAPLDPIADGASCDRCGGTVTGAPIATALTDEKGHFVLQDVPVGASVPLVIQIGKWRRQVTIPSVAACADNPLTDASMTRLPRNQSEGHIPKIALTTGARDALECLLRKVGLDDAEFTSDAGGGRVNLFAGDGGTNSFAWNLNGGTAFANVQPWWNSADNLMKYDIILYSCEGDENPPNKPLVARQAFLQYTSAGGRAFLSHWHNYWLEHGPAPLPSVATFDHQDDLPDPFTATIDTSFPKGQAMADWLLNVGASTTRGQLVIRAGQHTVNTANPATSQRWLYGDAVPSSPQVTLHNPTTQYFSFNTPVDASADQQCGRVVMSDIHVSNTGATPSDSSAINEPFPTGCVTTNLSAQEKALEFMLFDLSSCIRRDVDIPTPPIVQ
jgi:hypothetical protein